MLATLTPAHPFFDLTRERSRSYLNWARRLAQAEALLLLFGSCALLDSGTAGHATNRFALVAAGMAILWLTLAYYVGRGSVRAAVILLGLSIAREVMVFMPAATTVANVFAPFILLDLLLFTQAVRGAVALSRPLTSSPLEVPVAAKPSRPVAVADGVRAPGFKWPVEWSESSATDLDPNSGIWTVVKSLGRSLWGPNFTLDFIVASFLVAVAMAWLNLITAAGPDNSGFGGIGVLVDTAYALFNLTAASLLFAAAYGGEKGKSWSGPARVAGYIMFLGCLRMLNLLLILAGSS